MEIDRVIYILLLSACVTFACDNTGLATCMTWYAAKLVARGIADEISANYPKSCEYIQEWHDCLGNRGDGCSDTNVYVKSFKDEKTRLSATPYSCQITTGSDTSSCGSGKMYWCMTIYATSLDISKAIDEETSNPDYKESCDQLQNWHNCIKHAKVGCSENHEGLKEYKKEFDRLTTDPKYKCEVDLTASAPRLSAMSAVAVTIGLLLWLLVGIN